MNQSVNAEVVKHEELPLVQPLINIYELEKEFLIEAELPGVRKENIEVTLEQDELTITGRRESTAPDNAEVLHRDVYPFQYFRELTLGQEVEREGITANFENGVLKIRLRKSQKAAAKKIAIA